MSPARREGGTGLDASNGWQRRRRQNTERRQPREQEACIADLTKLDVYLQTDETFIKVVLSFFVILRDTHEAPPGAPLSHVRRIKMFWGFVF